MDPKFADRMGELGEFSDEALKARWSVVVDIAGATDSHAKARLVLLACRDQLVRDTDTWFWEPFRAIEENFRVDDSVETHARLAEACARYLINDGDLLTAVLAKIAILSGREPVSSDLAVDAEELLEERVIEVPTFEMSKPYYMKATQQTIKPEEGEPGVQAVASAVDTVAIASQDAISALGACVNDLLEWARDANQRFGSEQQIVTWLLGGVRADANPWRKLDSAVVAIDAAYELEAYLNFPPQPRHEAVLGQVLAVSGAKQTPVKASATSVTSTFASIDDGALQSLCPISHNIATGEDLPAVSPYDLAIRVLWECAALRQWAEE